MTAMLAALAGGAMVQPAAAQSAKPWYKTDWDVSRAKPCDRACLVGFMDGYLHAMETRTTSGLPLAEEVWVTENTARIDLGEGILWRADLKATSFRVTAADPVTGQVAVQTVYDIQGKPALVAIRLKIDRRMITEVEELLDRNVAPEAMALLQAPRPELLNDVAPKDRSSREVMLYAANAYFDALTGENGKIAPFADECIRHEQGYQTVNNKTPGRAAPSPVVLLNRAAALGMRDGPEAGLAAIEMVLSEGGLDDYPLAHAARADMQRRLGLDEAARASYRRALELTRQTAERRFLEARLAQLARRSL